MKSPRYRESQREETTADPLQTFVAILAAVKYVGTFPASDPVHSPFWVAGKDVDSHMLIALPVSLVELYPV